MNDIPASLNSKEQPESPAMAKITMNAEHVANMKVGEPVLIHVKGKVKSINSTVYSDPKPSKYDVELGDVDAEHDAENQELQEDPKGVKGNDSGDDENYATMPKDKLKKMITPKDGKKDSYGY